MKITLLLVTIFSAGLIVMTQSVSSVEYQIANDQRVTSLDLKIETFEKMFNKCTFLFKKLQRTVTTSPEWERLTDKISAMKTIQEDGPPRSAGIQLLLQILLGLIVIGILSILAFGTGFASLVGSLLSLIGVVLISIVIFLFSIIKPVA
jgi:hypothetical protein